MFREREGEGDRDEREIEWELEESWSWRRERGKIEERGGDIDEGGREREGRGR